MIRAFLFISLNFQQTILMYKKEKTLWGNFK